MFDIHGPNSGHHFFFWACKRSGLVNLAKYNPSVMHQNKLQPTKIYTKSWGYAVAFASSLYGPKRKK